MDLKQFFEENNKVALAFSGGVDSSYLLYAGKKYGADIKAYYVKTVFQPAFELEDALKVGEFCNSNIDILELDILAQEEIATNPCNRCYFCKRVVFSKIMEAAKADGYTTIIDGTNASDEESDRPGMRALQEMKVLSPLRICNLRKNDIRRLSKDAGLFTWNKPSFACLATRIPSGDLITDKKLRTAEEAEKMMYKLGFVDFRVRMIDRNAIIQVTEDQLPLVLETRQELISKLMPDFDKVLLDLRIRK